MEEYKPISRKECELALKYLTDLAHRVIQPPPLLDNNPNVEINNNILDTLIKKAFNNGKDRL